MIMAKKVRASPSEDDCRVMLAGSLITMQNTRRGIASWLMKHDRRIANKAADELLALAEELWRIEKKIMNRDGVMPTPPPQRPLH